jgi:hypothetical protein
VATWVAFDLAPRSVRAHVPSVPTLGPIEPRGGAPHDRGAILGKRQYRFEQILKSSYTPAKPAVLVEDCFHVIGDELGHGIAFLFAQPTVNVRRTSSLHLPLHDIANVMNRNRRGYRKVLNSTWEGRESAPAAVSSAPTRARIGASDRDDRA